VVELSVTVRTPVRYPRTVGVKVTVMLQEPFGGTDAPTQLTELKSPVTAIALIFRADEPVFVTVSVREKLVPRTTVPRPRLVVEKAAV